MALAMIMHLYRLHFLFFSVKHVAFGTNVALNAVRGVENGLEEREKMNEKRKSKN